MNDLTSEEIQGFEDFYYAYFLAGKEPTPEEDRMIRLWLRTDSISISEKVDLINRVFNRLLVEARKTSNLKLLALLDAEDNMSVVMVRLCMERIKRASTKDDFVPNVNHIAWASEVVRVMKNHGTIETSDGVFVINKAKMTLTFTSGPGALLEKNRIVFSIIGYTVIDGRKSPQSL